MSRFDSAVVRLHGHVLCNRQNSAYRCTEVFTVQKKRLCPFGSDSRDPDSNKLSWRDLYRRINQAEYVSDITSAPPGRILPDRWVLGTSGRYIALLTCFTNMATVFNKTKHKRNIKFGILFGLWAVKPVLFFGRSRCSTEYKVHLRVLRPVSASMP